MLEVNFNAINNRFDINETKLNKCFDTNDAKFEQYKEQNMKFENSIKVKLDELKNSLCSIDERINEIRSETTVSYTHLDVYKRQQPHHGKNLPSATPLPVNSLSTLSLIHQC